MAAREGVGTAHKRPFRIGCKRVTSVEVNSNRDVALRNEASWGYMVKPHGSLVSVSSMHCCTSTPDLSTTWS
jgi:hypothetical protein